MAIKMIICDVDGTLVEDQTKLISPANIKVLKKAQEQGILVTLASGRVPAALTVYANELEIASRCKYVVGANGGTVYDVLTGEYLYDEVCNYSDTLWAVNLVQELGYDFYLAPLDEQKAYISSQKAIEQDYFLFKHTNIIPEVIDFQTIPQMRKIVISCQDRREQDKIKQLVAPYDTLRTAVTGYGFIEIGPKNVNKWQGIIKLVEFLRTRDNIYLHLNEIMCFGDQMNDYEMIKNAKYGVAVGNAVAELKEVAYDVTVLDNNNSAIADYLLSHDIVKEL